MRRALLAAALALAGCDASQSSSSSIEVKWSGSPQFTRQAFVPDNLPAFFDCLREHSWTAVSAHRGGARRGLAENSISTFEGALAEAPVFLEIDVRAARDGLVIMHDETVDRTTNGVGDVAELTVSQIQALTLRGGGHPPSLREVLDWAAGKTVLELDVKQDVRFEDVIAAVRAAGAMNRVVFVIYSVSAAVRFARLAPDAMLYVTITDEGDLDELMRRNVDLSHVVAWTGDDEPNSALNTTLTQRGVEARFGMFGDAPANQAAAYAETGLQSISTDAPRATVAALDESDGVQGYGALQCAASR